jgi:outer membrane usher protein
MSLLSSRRALGRRAVRGGWLLVAALVASAATLAHAQTPPPQEDPEGEPAPPSQEGEPEPPPQEGEPTPAPPPAPVAPDQEGGDPPAAPAEPAPPPPPVEAAPAPAPEILPEQIMPEVPDVLLAPFTLTVNEVVKGETIIALANGEVFVQPAELEAAGLVRVPAGQQRDFQGLRFVSLKSISPPLSFELDEHNIALRITAPLDMLPPSSFDVTAKPPNIDYQAPTSMFVNYSLRLTSEQEYEAYQEMAVSHGGDLMFSSMSLSSTGAPIRGMTNYTINERSRLRRLILGDAAVGTGGLGGSVLLAGWTLSRAYDLDPYVVKQPSLKYLGSTMTPASLDVYVNGVRVHSLDLQPGRFELNNLRVNQGAGDAMYVLRDVFGKETVVENPFYQSDLLAKGLDDFTYSVGIQRTSTTDSWAYERPVLLAFHRYGFTESWTLGGRLEAAEGVVSAGPSVTTATLLGELAFAAAASTQRGSGAGWAASLGYSYLSSRVGGGALASVSSDHYSTLSLDAEGDRVVKQGSVFVAVPMGKWATTGLNGLYSVTRDRGTSWTVGSNCTLNVLPSVPLSLVGIFNDWGDSHDWKVTLTASMNLGESHRAAVALEEGSAGPAATASVSTPLYGNGFAYSVDGQATLDRQTLNGSARYQSSVGRYGAAYSVSNDGEHYGAAEAAGAVVLVPGVGLFASLPVTDAFGVLRIPGVKGVTVMLNNQDVTKTDRNGNALVPGLLSYYGNRMSFKLGDIPMSYEVKKTEQVVAPPQRGAAIAVFPSAQPRYFRGTFVVDVRGKRVIPEYGQARVSAPKGEEDEIVPLGLLGEFELMDPEPGVHQVTVEYLSGTCRFELNIPASTETVLDLGEQVCVRP